MSDVGTDGLSDGLSDDGSSSEEGARRSEADCDMCLRRPRGVGRAKSARLAG